MPIYAYKCESCGHAKDVLQKLSDAPLTECPACGTASFRKQLTAAGFQLKGSGWYATDFRNGGAKPPAGGDGVAQGGEEKGGEAKTAEGPPADTKAGDTNAGASKPAESKPSESKPAGKVPDAPAGGQ
jgi:putative FmdB family regulatory protein